VSKTNSKLIYMNNVVKMHTVKLPPKLGGSWTGHLHSLRQADDGYSALQ